MTPEIDYWEASVPTHPCDLKSGDEVAVTSGQKNTVVAVLPKPTPSAPKGADITLRSGNAQYVVYRRSPLNVVKP